MLNIVETKKNHIKFTIIITSFNEQLTIKRSIKALVEQKYSFINKNEIEIIVVAPDLETISSAKKELESQNVIVNYKVIKDEGKGKPVALNIAFKESLGEILILTDGDVYIGQNSLECLVKNLLNPDIQNNLDQHKLEKVERKSKEKIKYSKSMTAENTHNQNIPEKNALVGGIGGHPLSQNTKNDRFGYYSHLFCEAANQRRIKHPGTPMSGYLYAFKWNPLEKDVESHDQKVGEKIRRSIYPIPKEIRAEDAYISAKIQSLGYVTLYETNSSVYVKFPENMSDWIKQKTRSLGGNVQIHHKRNIFEDLTMLLFPIKYAKTPKELYWSLTLYPLRLYLWIIIYLNHLNKNYKSGAWERIESTK